MILSTLSLAAIVLPFAWAVPAPPEASAALKPTTTSSRTTTIPTSESTTGTLAPLKTGAVETIPDSYVVVFKNETDDSAQKKMRDYIHGQAKARNKTMKGVAATFKLKSISGYSIMTDKATVNEIRNSPLVAYVEKDAVIKAAYLDHNPAVNPEEAGPNKRFNAVQRTSLWNLPRIAHRSNAGNQNYIYDITAGLGTRVYVIDSGILTSHDEFGGRAVWGQNFIANSPNTDENGHGTHVAGTIGGTTYGVAKMATVVAVKVLNAAGAGSTSGLVSGIQWAVTDAIASGNPTRAVINMSLGGGTSSILNSAVAAAVAAGINVVVAAGNSGANAVDFSPASVTQAITVGATDYTDTRAPWSNFGTPLDVFAPGVAIQSAWIGGNSASAILSGTSMACPHVAGLAAYLITKEGLLTPLAVSTRIAQLATRGLVNNAGTGSPNLLAYNGNGQ